MAISTPSAKRSGGSFIAFSHHASLISSNLEQFLSFFFFLFFFVFHDTDFSEAYRLVVSGGKTLEDTRISADSERVSTASAPPGLAP